MMARQKVRQHHEVIPATASTPEILVVRSSRRRRTVSAQPQEDGSIRLLVPGGEYGCANSRISGKPDSPCAKEATGDFSAAPHFFL